jgi:hypothetical protein
MGSPPEKKLFLSSRCTSGTLGENKGMGPESLLSDKTNTLREGSCPSSQGTDPSKEFIPSCRICKLLRFTKLLGMLPERRFSEHENICKLSKFPKDSGIVPRTEPEEIVSSDKKFKLPKRGLRLPVRPGDPAVCGPSHRLLTLLKPSTFTHCTPLNDTQGLSSVVELEKLNCHELKKVPPGRSHMLSFTACNTPKSTGWSCSC